MAKYTEAFDLNLDWVEQIEKSTLIIEGDKIESIMRLGNFMVEFFQEKHDKFKEQLLNI